MQVIHHPRAAWDMARVIAGAVPDDQLFDWLRAELGALFGPATEAALTATRDRLRRAGDARLPVESGLWRVKLEDALRERPEHAAELATLTATARGLLQARRP
ncbi:hypothetical protein [Micromonospora auratinigra]|uniref:Uncharacterized protein n=1 Tax=Micromonospora auratinigra TaxID=261654 RepID=A0A1A9A9D9_9ACTN|nr:hypothetical protein [Micromonospora auratinigra]SBT52723.1 hypothetical protein GA0070611_5757 [Micromonospora auratinigra]